MRTSKIINGIKKVYFISLLYFNAGEGDDYIYRSQNSLIGVNTNDKLRISSKGNNIIRLSEPSNITPECYVIRLENFKRSKTTPIEDWMDYLKTGNIRRETIAPGLQEAREKLLYYSLDKAERTSYYNHLSAIMVQNDVLDTAKMEGRAEGRAEGEAKGRAEEKVSIARGLIKMNMPLTDIANVTGLSIEEIKEIEA
jgi:predicted transposase/invertase (TIGR01784 family)